MPEELEYTYTYISYQFIIGARLLTKDFEGSLSEEERQRAEHAKEVTVEADEMLKDYMRSWQAGNLRKSESLLHSYFEKYVKNEIEEADEYSTELMNADSPIKRETTIE